MSKVSKVMFLAFMHHCMQSTHFNGTHVKAVKGVNTMNNWSKAMDAKAVKRGKRSSKYIVMGVMLCMSKGSKEAQKYKHIFAHNFLNIQ